MPVRTISFFSHMDDRRNDSDFRFRLCSHTNELIKRLIVIWPTIRVTRTVLGHSSDENQLGSDDFCPRGCDGEKMSISKRPRDRARRGDRRPRRQARTRGRAGDRLGIRGRTRHDPA